MYEEIRYPVCPFRNVPAAYQRFLGPDSGGIERFFPGELAQRYDGTVLVVRVHSQKAVTEAVQAVEEFNGWLSRAWVRGVSTSHAAAVAGANDLIRFIGRVATLLFGSRPARAGA
ncbi:MAG: hypothetical protein ACJ8G4_06870 [Burkholderiales bacterium]